MKNISTAEKIGSNIVQFPVGPSQPPIAATSNLDMIDLITGGRNCYMAVRFEGSDIIKFLNTETDEFEWVLCRIGGYE